ncbi:MAG: hypothetical protein GY785_22490 [Gammaproteobacteria bacterium]|nr:hypothetical protein [Gammaproteobacteria bacterium]
MAQIVTRYLVVILLVSLGFFGVGALASVQELRDPMLPPPLEMQKFREAEWVAQPNPSKAVSTKGE